MGEQDHGQIDPLRVKHGRKIVVVNQLSSTLPLINGFNVSVSLIIPTRNQHVILDRALKSLARAATQTSIDTQVVIIDNQSDEPDSQRYLESLDTQAPTWGLENVSVIKFDEPFNFSKMNNIAVKETESEFVCFLNNDIEVIADDWLGRLLTEISQPEIGCAGGLLFYPNDTVQHAGVIVGMGTIAGHAYVGLSRKATTTHPYFQQSRFCSAVTGACLALRRDVFERVEGFDERLAVAFNDIDLCLKVQQAGYKNTVLPDVQLYHHESLSRGKNKKTAEAKARHRKEIRHMQDKWGSSVASDPYWNVSNKRQAEALDAHTHSFRKRWWRIEHTSYQHKDFS